MSLNFIILRHVGVISHQDRQLQKSYKVDFTGPPCSRTHMHSARLYMMPLNPILVIEIFDCWGIDFMGPFPPSFGFFFFDKM